MKRGTMSVLLALMVSACQTTNGPPPASGAVDSPAAMQAEMFRPPPPGTGFVFQVTEWDTAKTETRTVLDDATPYEGVPVFRVSDGVYVYVYNRNTGNQIATLEKGGRPRTSLSPDSGRYSWPLQVGKRWTARYSYADHVRGRSWDEIATLYRVAGYEDVTVPAGTYGAFRIEHSPGQRNATKGTIWFSPDLGIIVKRQYERTADHYLGYTRIDTELIEYRESKSR